MGSKYLGILQLFGSIDEINIGLTVGLTGGFIWGFFNASSDFNVNSSEKFGFILLIYRKEGSFESKG